MADTKEIVTAEPNPTVLHSEHKQWRSDNSMWREDVAAWEQEIDKSYEELAQIEKGLRAHREALQTHAAAIRAYEQDMIRHEHTLTEFAQGGPGGELRSLAKTHETVAVKHEQQRNAHERIKKNHHTLIAQWQLLLKAMRAPL